MRPFLQRRIDSLLDSFKTYTNNWGVRYFCWSFTWFSQMFLQNFEPYLLRIGRCYRNRSHLFWNTTCRSCADWTIWLIFDVRADIGWKRYLKQNQSFAILVWRIKQNGFLLILHSPDRHFFRRSRWFDILHTYLLILTLSLF